MSPEEHQKVAVASAEAARTFVPDDPGMEALVLMLAANLHATLAVYELERAKCVREGWLSARRT